MHFFVYSVNLKTFNVTLYSSTKTKTECLELLSNEAINFVRCKCGDEHSKNAFIENVNSITKDGYYLINDPSTETIKVYQRQSNIVKGTVWNSYTVDCEHVYTFGITCTDSINYRTISSNYNVLNTITSSGTGKVIDRSSTSELMAELRTCLRKRNQRIIIDSDSDLE